MKIRLEIGETREGYETNDLYIDDKPVIYIYPLCECPEDAIIGRGLVSGPDIINRMRGAYEAGKKGEEFEVETIKLEQDE